MDISMSLFSFSMKSDRKLITTQICTVLRQACAQIKNYPIELKIKWGSRCPKIPAKINPNLSKKNLAYE